MEDRWEREGVFHDSVVKSNRENKRSLFYMVTMFVASVVTIILAVHTPNADGYMFINLLIATLIVIWSLFQSVLLIIRIASEERYLEGFDNHE
jgi:hypothetical protein